MNASMDISALPEEHTVKIYFKEKELEEANPDEKS